MIQRFAVGDLVHNIKTDEVGTVKELLLDTAHSPRYKVAVAKDTAKAGAHSDAQEAVWNETDLIHSSHKASS